VKKNDITSTEIFLTVLALVLVSVSFYQTWVGLQQIFGPASMPIAFVLSSLLLFLCWQIRNAKLNRQPYNGLMGIYAFIAIFCFMANFNALYTRFMRTDIYATELRRINDAFNSLENDVQPKLNYKYPKDTAREAETLKAQLMAQIQDKGKPGIGRKSIELIHTLEQLLSVRIDILVARNDDYQDLAVRMGQQIDGMLSDLSPTEKELKTVVNQGVIKWNGKIKDYLLSSKTAKDTTSQELIDNSITDYNKLGERAAAVLGPDKFKFTELKSNTQEIGKIGYAFSHAVNNFGVYQLIVLMGCLLLDFFLPIMVILIIKPSVNRSSSLYARGNMRKGGVLTPKN
jgi:hypothetical protein